MPIYSADQIIDKALFARVPVNVLRTAEDTAKPVYTAKPGERIGTVYAWLDVKPGTRKNLYWMFYDQNNKPYFVEHAEGRFNVDDLKEQGAITVKEQIEADRKKNLSATDKITNALKAAGIGLGIFLLAKSFIETRNK